MGKKIIAILLSLVMVTGVIVPVASAVSAEDFAGAPELDPGDTEISITTAGVPAYYYLDVPVTDLYSFYHDGETAIYIYDSGFNQVDYYPPNTGGSIELEGPATYYLTAGFTDSTATGSFTLSLELHEYEVTADTDPTCTEPGVHTEICTYCGDEQTVYAPALGHNSDYSTVQSNDDGTHDVYCVNCGEIINEPCGYIAEEENGTQKFTCFSCGYERITGYDDFETVCIWDFEDEPDDWEFTDADGDSFNWEYNKPYHTNFKQMENSTGCLISASYDSSTDTPLYPDNWAVSPAFSLQGVSGAALSLWAAGQDDDDYIYEHFAIYAGTSADIVSMTKISTDFISGLDYVNYFADLSAFDGEETVYIAIRHYNTSDQFWLDIDNVSVIYGVSSDCWHSLQLMPALVEPTCTQGSHSEPYYLCELCGRAYLDEYATELLFPGDIFEEPALGHDWGSPISYSNGIHSVICKRCGKSITENCDYDIEVSGSTATYTCKVCGYQYTGAPSGEAQIEFWGFETDPADDGWTFVDANNDSKNWVWNYDDNTPEPYEGSGNIRSYSYQGSAITPDNWAISPAFTLKGAETATLSFYAKGRNYNEYYSEVFAVYAGTSNDPSLMTEISESDITTGNAYKKYTFDLADFAGEETVYIAIRHYNCYDQYWLDVDNVAITAEYPSQQAECEHDLVYHPAVNEPTCTEPSYLSYYQCSLCGKAFTDAEAENPVSIIDLIEAPALGHDCTPWDSNGDGTHSCTCVRCNADITEDCVLETTFKGGFVISECDVCGYYNIAPYSGTVTVASWDFETDPEVDGWSFIDADNDTNNWIWARSGVSNLEPHGGNCSLRSYSYYDNIGIEPDNWAVSPAFSLAYMDNPEISFWAKGKNGSSWSDEVFAVYAGTSPDIGDMAKLSDDITTENTYTKYTFDLSPLAGEGTVYIAIRHYNCYNEYWIDVDDIVVTADTPDAGCTHELTYYPALDEPTCTEPSHSTAFYQCELCGRAFLDAEATLPAFPEELYEEPALGHDWGDPEWSWDGLETATATFECAECGETTKITTANILESVEDTAYAYTAKVRLNGAVYSDVKREPRIYIYAHSLTLEGVIGVNYYAYIPDVSYYAYAEFTVGGETRKVYIDTEDVISDDESNVYYKFTCYVSSAQIDSPVTCIITNGDTVSEPFEYTVQTYLAEIESDPQLSSDTMLVNLAKSIATYGYYANGLFGYNQNFVKSTMFDDSGFDEVTAEALQNYAGSIDDTEDGVIYYGSSLLLRSSTTIRHYFKLPEGKTADDFTFDLLQGGYLMDTLIPVASGNLYYVEIDNIPAPMLAHEFRVRVTDSDGNTVNNWNYSALSYAYKALSLESSSDALINTVKALAIYHRCAAAYFN